jgi:hypothetical protein
VHADLGTAASHPEHQMGAGANRWKAGQPDVLEHAQDAQLALLVDQCVVGDDREVEMQLTPPGWT